MARSFADLTVYGVASQPSPGWSADIYQSEYRHDVCVVRALRETVANNAIPASAPMRLTWGRDHGRTTTWNGYVVQPKVGRSVFAQATGLIHGLSASTVFRDAGTRNWPAGATTATAVRLSATAQNFSSLVEATTSPAPGGPVNSETQWDYLVRTAQQAGFTLYCPSTDLRCHSRAISAALPTPVFVHTTSAAVPQQGGLGLVFSYAASVSADVPGMDEQRIQRRAFGVSDNAQIIRLTDIDVASATSTTVTSNYSNTTSHDFFTARGALDSAGEKAKFYYRLSAELSGDERVRQGSTITIKGADAALDGYWYVLSVVHHINTQDIYTMSVELGRDELGDTSPPASLYRQVVIAPGVREAQRPPAATLIDNRTTLQRAASAPFTGTWVSSLVASRSHTTQQGTVLG